MKKKFSLINLILIFTASLTALTACDSKSVKDDWPGIDSLNEDLDSKSFNFDSELSLPKMGKDISYTITSVCNRKLPLSGSGGQKTYSRSSSFKSSENHRSSEDIINILPTEVLIYPEFFTGCSFQIKASNEIGSTESPAPVEMDFKYSGLRTYITTSLPMKTELNKHVKAVKIKELHLLTFNSSWDDHEEEVQNIKLLCFSKKLSENPLYEEALKTSSFNGSTLRLPPMTAGFPVEDCIIKAALSSNGKAIISKRFQVLNSHILQDISINQAPSPLFSQDFKGGYSIKYNKALNQGAYKFLSVQIQNRSNENTVFKISSLLQKSPLLVIEGISVKEFSVALGAVPMEFDFKKIETPFVWHQNGEPLYTSSIHLKAQSSTVLDLVILPAFTCTSRLTGAPSEELGFVVPLDVQSPLLEVKQFATNEFMKTPFFAGSLFELATASNDSNERFRRSNFPSPYMQSTNDIKLYFKNGHYKESLDLLYPLMPSALSSSSVTNEQLLPGYKFLSKVSRGRGPVDSCSNP